MDTALPDSFFEGLEEVQVEAMATLLSAMEKNKKKVTIEAPPRFGKKVIAWKFLEGVYEMGALPRMLISVPTRAVRLEFMDDGKMFAPKLFKAGLVEEITSVRQALESKAKVLVMSKALVGMLQKEDPDFLKSFGGIIEDEGHLDLSATRQADHNSTEANKIALTATSRYSQVKSLEAAGYETIYTISNQEAVERGVISQIRNVLVEVQDVQESLDDLPTAGDDFEPRALDAFLIRSGVIEKAALLNVENAKIAFDAGRRPNVSMGFLNYISSVRLASKIFNRVWRENMSGYPQYSRESLWKDMPDDVREFFTRNDMEDEVGPIAIPVWGQGMPENVRNYIVAAHRSAKVLFVPSAAVFIHGYTNSLVADIHNIVPSLSGVPVGQRAGRAFGLDDSLPDKIATIYDYIYPGMFNYPLTYGAWAGGFVFRRSDEPTERHYEKSPRYNPAPLPEVPGLRIIADEREVIRYDRDSRLLSETSRRSNLGQYPRPIAVEMARAGLTSMDAFFAAARKHLRSSKMTDDHYWRLNATRERIIATLRGEKGGEPVGRYGYTPAAIIISATLQRAPKDLFGVAVSPRTAEWRDTSGITRRKQQEYLDYVNFREPHLFKSFEPAQQSIPLDDPEIGRALAQTDAFRSVDPEEFAFRSELSETLKSYLRQLSPRNDAVLRMRSGWNFREMSYAAIGDKLNLPGTAVKSIESAAIRRIKGLNRMAESERRLELLYRGKQETAPPPPPSSVRKKVKWHYRDRYHFDADTPGELADKLEAITPFMTKLSNMDPELVHRAIAELGPDAYSRAGLAHLADVDRALLSALLEAGKMNIRVQALWSWKTSLGQFEFYQVPYILQRLTVDSHSDEDTAFFNELKQRLITLRTEHNDFRSWADAGKWRTENSLNLPIYKAQEAIGKPRDQIQKEKHKLQSQISTLRNAQYWFSGRQEEVEVEEETVIESVPEVKAPAPETESSVRNLLKPLQDFAHDLD